MTPDGMPDLTKACLIADGMGVMPPEGSISFLGQMILQHAWEP